MPFQQQTRQFVVAERQGLQVVQLLRYFYQLVTCSDHTRHYVVEGLNLIFLHEVLKYERTHAL
jgi:hypothetical protein